MEEKSSHFVNQCNLLMSGSQGLHYRQTRPLYTLEANKISNLINER